MEFYNGIPEKAKAKQPWILKGRLKMLWNHCKFWLKAKWSLGVISIDFKGTAYQVLVYL